MYNIKCRLDLPMKTIFSMSAQSLFREVQATTCRSFAAYGRQQCGPSLLSSLLDRRSRDGDWRGFSAARRPAPDQPVTLRNQRESAYRTSMARYVRPAAGADRIPSSA